MLSIAFIIDVCVIVVTSYFIVTRSKPNVRR